MHSETPAVRARILAAATTIVARDGAEHLSTANVAREAELSVGGLRYHFESKRELLAGLVDYGVEGFDRAMAAAGTEPGDRTRAYIAATLDADDRDPAAALIAAIAIDSTLLTGLQAHFARWQALLDADGIDRAVATSVRLAIDGWWLAAFLQLAPPRGRAAADARALLESLVDGAARG